MKKNSYFLAVVFILFSFSCTNNQESVLKNQNNTLKNTISEKTKNVTWTKEIEGNRLNENIVKNEIANKNVSLSPEFFSSINNYKKDTYPELKNGTSLDISQVNKDLLEYVNNFSNDFCKGIENIENYINSSYIFNYIFFLSDFKSIFDDENQTFDKFLLCQPFISEELIQFPIRFYNKKDYIDLSVYINYSSGYNVFQIEIAGWEKADGQKESK